MQRVRAGGAQNHIKKLAAFLPYTATSSHDPRALAPNEGGVRCRPTDSKLAVLMQEHPDWSWGRRVCGSLRSFAPSRVCWTESRLDAAVEIVHVDGEHELAYAEGLKAPFVVIQHGLTCAPRTTAPAHKPQTTSARARHHRPSHCHRPSHTARLDSRTGRQQNVWQKRPPREAYERLWQRALLTVSFQDLEADAASKGYAFYPMPWGANENGGRAAWNPFVAHASVEPVAGPPVLAHGWCDTHIPSPQSSSHRPPAHRQTSAHRSCSSLAT